MKIAIIGVGLIGGSIGLGLKKVSANRIIGIPRREETIGLAISRGAIDEGTTDLNKGVAEADLIFICTPINLIPPILKEIAPWLKKGAVVTDVASSKEKIVTQAEKILPTGTFFVGGHPMAGKEEVKLEAAEDDLFSGKTWIFTPTPKTNNRALELTRSMVKLLSCKIIEMDPKLHDLAVAGISHMPLAVAASVVNAVGDAKSGKEDMKALAASGFRDTTRIASGDPVLGVDMFTTNDLANEFHQLPPHLQGAITV